MISIFSKYFQNPGWAIARNQSRDQSKGQSSESQSREPVKIASQESQSREPLKRANQEACHLL